MSTYSLPDVDEEKLRQIEAETLRRLLAHFRSRADVQNIDLMLLAGFCRNCLSKWFANEARRSGVDLSLESAREYVYGMPYHEYKAEHQLPVSQEKLKRLDNAMMDDPSGGS